MVQTQKSDSSSRNSGSEFKRNEHPSERPAASLVRTLGAWQALEVSAPARPEVAEVPAAATRRASCSRSANIGSLGVGCASVLGCCLGFLRLPFNPNNGSITLDEPETRDSSGQIPILHKSYLGNSQDRPPRISSFYPPGELVSFLPSAYFVTPVSIPTNTGAVELCCSSLCGVGRGGLKSALPEIVHILQFKLKSCPLWFPVFLVYWSLFNTELKQEATSKSRASDQ